ncbi:MAG: YgiQ family radical SAM protein [Anaerolineaceae bacterium]|nr:YgiQ family radical SAM protein [Anaerolineaceae bacterium]
MNKKTPLYLPTTAAEISDWGWDALDVILVSGDSYIDSPFIGAALIGRVLVNAGFRVGIIAQPDIDSAADIARLGEPRLFWGITAGSIDSMVANYTASRKPRRTDDYTPGGENNRRPDRATIVYTNLVRRYFKNTVPIVLGGIEASLRRVSHYDYWSNKIRRSVLFDAKADLLVYGMAEGTVVELARRLQEQKPIEDLRGICYIAKEQPKGARELPSHETVTADKHAFIEMFHQFYRNNDPLNAETLCQLVDTRYWVQNPPAHYLSESELDAVYRLDFQRSQHPYYEQQGAARALETIRFAIPTHRGCYGECNFCAIAVHEGRKVRWRSQDSIVAEAKLLSKAEDFKGYILDVSAPTANMYGFECSVKSKQGSCKHRRCIYPEICPQLPIDHSRHRALLRELRQIDGVKKVFVSSGIRYDLILADEQHGDAYLRDLVEHHISGQMKVAPEHTEDRVLNLMGKPDTASLVEFKKRYDRLNEQLGKKQFMTYYLIAAYPGCTDEDMRRLQKFTSQKLKIHPEQVQIFTPTPSTYASLMYYTEIDPFTGQEIYVAKDDGARNRQKKIVVEARRQQPPVRKTGRPGKTSDRRGSSPRYASKKKSTSRRSKS